MTNPTPLLEIRNLRTWYPVRQGVLARVVDYVRAVDGVDLTILPGETLGIVGESGCGKSTLARTILRLEHPRTGEIQLDGHDVLRLKGAALQAYRRAVQVVFQDPLASLNPRLTILDQVTEGLLAQGLIQPSEQRAVALKLLQDVGLGPETLERYPHAFSGGQRQRICIARALALGPRLLICDEAVSALDLSVRAQVLNLLAELRNRRQLAYLFITHDIGVVQHLADRIAVMYLGKIVELGPAETVLNTPAHPYTRLLLASVPKIGRKMNAESGMRNAESGVRSAECGMRNAECGVRRSAGRDSKPDAPKPEAGSRTPHSALRTPHSGCPFAPRCPLVMDCCRAVAPCLHPVDPGGAPHQVACFRSGAWHKV